MYDVPSITMDTLISIIQYNGCTYTEILAQKDEDELLEDDISFKNILFCFRSLFNHDRDANAGIECITSNLIFIFASEDIGAEEEITIDYCD